MYVRHGSEIAAQDFVAALLLSMLSGNTKILLTCGRLFISWNFFVHPHRNIRTELCSRLMKTSNRDRPHHATDEAYRQKHFGCPLPALHIAFGRFAAFLK